MKVCNYCGTGMDNGTMKCPFCGQPMDVKGAIRFQDNKPWDGDTSVFSTVKYTGKTRAEQMVEESDRQKKWKDLFKKKEASSSHPEHDTYSFEEMREYEELKEESNHSETGAEIGTAADDSDKENDWSSILKSATGSLLGQKTEQKQTDWTEVVGKVKNLGQSAKTSSTRGKPGKSSSNATGVIIGVVVILIAAVIAFIDSDNSFSAYDFNVDEDIGYYDGADEDWNTAGSIETCYDENGEEVEVYYSYVSGLAVRIPDDYSWSLQDAYDYDNYSYEPVTEFSMDNSNSTDTFAASYEISYLQLSYTDFDSAREYWVDQTSTLENYTTREVELTVCDMGETTFYGIVQPAKDGYTTITLYGEGDDDNLIIITMNSTNVDSGLIQLENLLQEGSSYWNGE